VTVAEEKVLPTEGVPEAGDSEQRAASVVVRDSEGSEVELDPTVFAAPVKPGLHYDAVRQYMAGRRAGTHATRNRALVAGGGRKPWRQKGTGNARVGSRRTPLWRGGGTVFGPQPRDYSYRLPGRMQRGALRSALSVCASEGRLRIFEDFGLAGPSTRAVLRRLGEWDLTDGRVLIVETAPSDDLYLSTRNLPTIEVVSVAAVHCYEVLKAKTVLIRRSALAALSEKLSEAGGR
jgi:large subunit ribosomal protein L4